MHFLGQELVVCFSRHPAGIKGKQHFAGRGLSSEEAGSSPLPNLFSVLLVIQSGSACSLILMLS